MKISVVGSINIDMTVSTDCIPLRGETRKGDALSYVPGGKGANQSVAIAKLGGDVEMFGCVGDDENGKLLLQNLKNMGVETGHIRIVEGVATGCAIIAVDDSDNTIIVIAGANDYVTREYIDSVKNELFRSQAVVLQHEIPQETVEYVVSLCAEHGIITVLNPAPARPVKPEIIEQVTFLTPNEHEAAIIFGADRSIEDMLSEYPGKLVVTRGAEGVSVCLKDRGILTVPSRKAKVVDTTGAGDTLNGAFIAQIVNGVGIEESLTFANVAASLSLEKFGAQGGMPSRAEVEDEMSRISAKT